jgi:ketosteroid isomerase-like protein
MSGIKRGKLILVLMSATLAQAAMSEDNKSTESLHWLAGHWCTDQGEASVEEIWLPPRGGVLIGMGRTSTANQIKGFEFLRIANVKGVQNFIAQPGGGPPTHFARTAGGEDWVRFENPEHDFPQRIEYRRNGDQLNAEVAGPGQNGEEAAFRLNLHICKATSPDDSGAEVIKAARAASNEAIVRQDVEGIVSYFDEEYVIITGSGVIEMGRDSQLGSWREHFDRFPSVVYVRSPTDVTLSEAESRAIENGTWVGTWTSQNGPQKKGGRYTAYWRNVDGNWKIRSELFVTLNCKGADC